MMLWVNNQIEMNIIGHSIKIVEIAPIKKLVEDMGECFERQCLTVSERNVFGFRTNRIQYLASRLAAKEAVLKVLFGDGKHPISWLEIEIQRLPTGEPLVVLSAKYQEIATKLDITKWLLSISHTPSYAAASVITLRDASLSRCVRSPFGDRL